MMVHTGTPSHVDFGRPYAERLIGTLRRDCLDHILIFGELHLLRILSLYSAYYNESRTHLALCKDAPLRRAVFNELAPLSRSRFYLDCIFVTRGYDFWEGQEFSSGCRASGAFER
jgi:hypothetical protein